MDPNTLAALLDGRLKGADRQAALARLAASPEDVELLGDVLAVEKEVGAVRDIGSRRRPWLDTKWLAVAAVLMLAVVLPMTLRRSGVPTNQNYASLLTSRGKLAPGWENHSWAATRGATDGMTERARGVRAGALTTAIDVASARGADSVVGRLAFQVAALFVDVPGAGAVVGTFREIAGGGTGGGPDRLRVARLNARALVPESAFDNGAWLEAARIAAIDHDSAFFAGATSRDHLASLQSDATADPRLKDDVDAATRAIGRGDWDAAAAATTNVLTLLAGP